MQLNKMVLQLANLYSSQQYLNQYNGYYNNKQNGVGGSQNGRTQLGVYAAYNNGRSFENSDLSESYSSDDSSNDNWSMADPYMPSYNRQKVAAFGQRGNAFAKHSFNNAMEYKRTNNRQYPAKQNIGFAPRTGNSYEESCR